MNLQLSLGVLLLAAAAADGRKLVILDEDEHLLPSTLAEKVCGSTQGSHKQLSRISSVVALAEHLQSVANDGDELSRCRSVYLDAIGDLRDLLQTKADNVCSGQKTRLLEAFHRNYMTPAKFGGSSARRAPAVIRSFFMHYAAAVADVCARETLRFLDQLAAWPVFSDGGRGVDELVRMAAHELGPASAALAYNDIYLPWSLLDALPRGARAKLDRYLTDGPTRLTLQVSRAKYVDRLQEVCAGQLEPLYAHSLLASLRLINLGYYPAGSALLERLNASPAARRFFELARLCELVLPVRVLQNESLERDRLLVLTRQEAQALAAPARQLHESQCSGCRLVSDRLETAARPAAAQWLVGKVKADLRSRKSALGRLISTLAKRLRRNLKLGRRAMFATRRGDRELELELEERLDKVDMDRVQLETAAEAEADEDEDHESGAGQAAGEQLSQLRRAKRNVELIVGFFPALLTVIVLGVFAVVYYVFSVFVVAPIVVLLHMFQALSSIDTMRLREFLCTHSHLKDY